MLKPFPSPQVPKAGLSYCKNNKYKPALYSSDCPEKASVTSPVSQWNLMPCCLFIQRNFISSASLALIYGVCQLYGLYDHVIYTHIHISIIKPLLYNSESLTEQRYEFMIQTAKQTRKLRQLEAIFLNSTILDSQLNIVNFNHQF